MVIELQRVSKKFGPHTVLQNIDLQLDVGEVLCVLGPNGSGKTTLLKIIAGLILPDEGQVAVMGHDLRTQPLKAKRCTGLSLAEGLDFYGRLTGFQNLSFFAALHGVSGAAFKERLSELVPWLGLKDILTTHSQKLSCGQQQRLSLARALLHDPPILLLDEPTKELDPNAQVDFRNLVLEKLVKAYKKTILWTTHQLAEAEAVGDRVVLLKGGRIVKDVVVPQMKACGLNLQGVYQKCFGSTGLS